MLSFRPKSHKITAEDENGWSPLGLGVASGKLIWGQFGHSWLFPAAVEWPLQRVESANHILLI